MEKTIHNTKGEKVNWEKVTDVNAMITIPPEGIYVKVGKRKFIHVVVDKK